MPYYLLVSYKTIFVQTVTYIMRLINNIFNIANEKIHLNFYIKYILNQRKNVLPFTILFEEYCAMIYVIFMYKDKFSMTHLKYNLFDRVFM